MTKNPIIIDDPVDPIPDGPEPAEPESRVPVQVAMRTAERLEETEAEIERLLARIAALEAELEAAVGASASIERAHAIERAAVDAGAVDVETVALLVSSAMEAGEAGSASEAVSALASSKPFLFTAAPAPPPGNSSFAAAPSSPRGGSSPGAAPPLALAAEEAGRTGDRAALLRYLRLRRNAI